MQQSDKDVYRSVQAGYDDRSSVCAGDLEITRGINGEIPARIRAYLQNFEDELAEAALSICEGLVLDSGCGNGNILVRMLEETRQGKFVGIDLSWGMLSRTKKRAGAANSTLKGLLQGNVVQLPFKTEVFDNVCCLEVLVHLPSKRAVLACLEETHRVLKPGGGLVASMLSNPLSLRGVFIKYGLQPFKNHPDTLISSIWLLKELQKKGFRVDWYRGWDRPVVNSKWLFWLNRPLNWVDVAHRRLSGVYPWLHLLRDRVVFRCVKER